MANDNHVEDFKNITSKQSDNAEPLFNRITDPIIKSANPGDYFESKNHTFPSFLPHVDLTGFEQEASYKSQGKFSDVLHGLKHLFMKDDSLAVKLQEKVEKDMKPEEKKKFDAENKALTDYHSKLLAWETQMNLNPGPMPQAPETPMHREVEKRVQAAEKTITEQLRAKMSPEDRNRLDKQFKTYEEQIAESQKIHNPLGTGEGFRPLPSPGHAIMDYFDRVKEETERYLNS